MTLAARSGTAAAPVPGVAQKFVLGSGLLPQLSRYTICSALALALDFALFLALTHGTHLRAAVAAAIGYASGMALHFLLSTRFVFDARQSGKSPARLFAEFAASGIVGLGITAAVVWLGVDGAGLPPVLAKAVAVAASFAAVFVLRRSLVFGASR